MPSPPGEGPQWFQVALRAPSRDRSLTVDGVPIRFREWGPPDGQRIVLVHGGLANGRWWDHVAPGLAVAGRTVVAIDLSGHGDSGHRPAYTVSAWSEEVRAVAGAGLPGHDARPPVLVGHSMGGAVAWMAAQRDPGSFESLVLIDSYLRIGALLPRHEREPRPLHRYPSRQAILAHFRTQPPQRVLLDYVVAHIATSSITEHTYGWTWKHDPRVFTRVREPLPPAAEHPCRTTFIRAECGIVDDSVVEGLRELLGRSFTGVVIPGAGHHVMLDRPCALQARLLEAITANHSPIGSPSCGT